MTSTCDVGTQTTYPPIPTVGPNVATVAHDDHNINPHPFMTSNSAIFSPNKSEAAFVLSSLFHGGGDECSAQTQHPTMTTNYSTNDLFNSSTPESATTTNITHCNGEVLRPNSMEFVCNNNVNPDVVNISYSGPCYRTATPTSCCCSCQHNTQLPCQTNHNNVPWEMPGYCNHHHQHHHHHHSHPMSQANNSNISWEPLPSRVSPSQYHSQEESRVLPNWSSQPEPSMIPTPSQWGQPHAPFASKNPMHVILEAARFAPSPVANTVTCRGEDESSGKRLRDISNEQSLVTPTPTSKEKKQRVDVEDTPSQAYSRKNKSLGVLAESFVRKYEGCPMGTDIVIDDTAIEFQVERRRIYDIIAILESLEFITRRHKNTYSWNGRVKLNQLLGRLQVEAIKTWPQVAVEAGLIEAKDAAEPIAKESGSQEHKSLGRLTQTYLKLFLAGHRPLSLPEASDIMHGDSASEEDGGTDTQSSDTQSKVAAGRVLKTRVRRLYDIANCASRIGFLSKVDCEDSRRPKFAWSYPLSPVQIKQLYENGSLDTVAEMTSSQEIFTQMDAGSSISGKASPPQMDQQFLAQIHHRGAEDDCAKPKAIHWNDPITNRAAPRHHGVGPRTVSVTSDWEGVFDHHHGQVHGQVTATAHFRRRSPTAAMWDNGRAAQPKASYPQIKGTQDSEDSSFLI